MNALRRFTTNKQMNEIVLRMAQIQKCQPYSYTIEIKLKTMQKKKKTIKINISPNEKITNTHPIAS